MIDGIDEILAHIRDVPRYAVEWQFISATGQDARTPRSAGAHGHEERDEDGHPVGTRVNIRLQPGSERHLIFQRRVDERAEFQCARKPRHRGLPADDRDRHVRQRPDRGRHQVHHRTGPVVGAADRAHAS